MGFVDWLIDAVRWLPLTVMTMLGQPLGLRNGVDVVFAFLTLLTYGTLIFRRWERLDPARWTRRATVLLFVVTVLAPLVPLTSFYLLSVRGMQVIGHWPRYPDDDPKGIGPDVLFDRLYALTDYAMSCGGWLMHVGIVLSVHLLRYLRRTTWLWLGAVFVISWTLFNGNDRFGWWLD